MNLTIDQMKAIVERAPYLNQKHCYLYWDESDGTYQILPVCSIVPSTYIRVDDLRAAIAEHDSQEKVTVCEWTADDEGNYRTACDNRLELGDGLPSNFKYCPYCGNKIKDHGHD